MILDFFVGRHLDVGKGKIVQYGSEEVLNKNKYYSKRKVRFPSQALGAGW